MTNDLTSRQKKESSNLAIFVARGQSVLDDAPQLRQILRDCRVDDLAADAEIAVDDAIARRLDVVSDVAEHSREIVLGEP